MASPPIKRQRTEEAPITRSDVWHGDGSVIFQADSTQFRVHWSVLALHSSFFREMQGLPQPPDQPSVEGCPVVELQDASKDVEHLLRALYNPALFNQQALSLDYIASFIRLGRKYDFKDLFNIAVERLTYENPSTLEEYEALLEPLRAARIPDFDYKPTRISNYPGVFFDILTLASENGLLAVLPCAYLRVSSSRGSPNVIFKGITKEAGITTTLSLTDQRICVAGREKLLHAPWKPDNTLGWLLSWNPTDNGCLETLKCTTFKNHVLRKCLAAPIFLAFSSVGWWKQATCTTCALHVEELLSKGRNNLWTQLPTLFGLPPWDELKIEM